MKKNQTINSPGKFFIRASSRGKSPPIGLKKYEISEKINPTSEKDSGKSTIADSECCLGGAEILGHKLSTFSQVF
jgi:hypothetical protein